MCGRQLLTEEQLSIKHVRISSNSNCYKINCFTDHIECIRTKTAFIQRLLQITPKLQAPFIRNCQ